MTKSIKTKSEVVRDTAKQHGIPVINVPLVNPEPGPDMAAQAWEDFARDESGAEAEKRKQEAAALAREQKHATEIEKVRTDGPKAEKAAAYRIFQAIAGELEKLGHDAAATASEFSIHEERDYSVDDAEARKKVGSWSYPQLEIPGLRWHRVEVREQMRSVSKWSGGKPTGLYRVTLGGYGDKRQFPPKKDGGHNYAEIAGILAHNIASEKAANNAEHIKGRNAVAVNGLRTELGLQEYWGDMIIKASADKGKSVEVTIKVCRNMTMAETRKLHAALVQAGVIKKEGA